MMFPTHKRFSDEIVEVEVDLRKVTYVKKKVKKFTKETVEGERIDEVEEVGG